MTASLRAILIEDNELDAALITAYLQLAGYTPHVQRVTTGPEFSAALAAGQWDLVLSDYSLPQFSVAAALKILHASGLDLPFIIISGVIGEEQAASALRAGAHDFVIKDRLTRLAPAITRELRDAEARQQRRQALADLDAREARTRALLQHSSDALLLLSAAGRVLYVSASTERILGYTGDELLNGDPSASIHPDDLPGVLRLLQELIPNPGALATAEYRVRHKDGSWRWLEASISNLLAEPAVGAIIFNYRDVTERVRAVEALAASEAQLRALFAAMTDVVMVVDRDGRYLQIAPTNPAQLVRPPAELLGLTFHDVTPAADADQSVAAIRRALETGETNDFDYRLVVNDTPRWFNASISPLGPDRVIWIARDITDRKQAEADIERQLSRQAAQTTIDRAIIGSLDLKVTLHIFLDQVVSQLGVDAADVLLLDPHDHTLVFAAGRGFHTHELEWVRQRVGAGRAGRAVLERRLIVAEDKPNPATAGRTRQLTREQFITYYGMPLIAKGQALGVLELFHRSPLAPGPEWLEFLESLANQAAIAVYNAALFDRLQRTNEDLQGAHEATLEGWARALDMRGREASGHTQRVTDLTLRLAVALGVPEADLIHIRRGALLHDVGNLGIPERILLKPGPLEPDEWRWVQQHPVFANELLTPIQSLRQALPIPYCHHEKWDGSGYPRQLQGAAIPLAARLFAVVDVWDALQSLRPYRPAWSPQQATQHLQDQAGLHFDPSIVETFLPLVRP